MHTHAEHVSAAALPIQYSTSRYTNQVTGQVSNNYTNQTSSRYTNQFSINCTNQTISSYCTNQTSSTQGKFMCSHMHILINSANGTAAAANNLPTLLEPTPLVQQVHQPDQRQQLHQPDQQQVLYTNQISSNCTNRTSSELATGYNQRLLHAPSFAW